MITYKKFEYTNKMEAFYKYKDFKMQRHIEREVSRRYGLNVYFFPATIKSYDPFYGEEGVKYENAFHIPVLFDDNEFETDTAPLQDELGFHLNLDTSLRVFIHKDDFYEFITRPLIAKYRNKPEIELRQFTKPAVNDIIIINKPMDEVQQKRTTAERFLKVTYVYDNLSIGVNHYGEKPMWTLTVKLAKWNNEKMEITTNEDGEMQFNDQFEKDANKIKKEIFNSKEDKTTANWKKQFNVDL